MPGDGAAHRRRVVCCSGALAEIITVVPVENAALRGQATDPPAITHRSLLVASPDRSTSTPSRCFLASYYRYPSERIEAKVQLRQRFIEWGCAMGWWKPTTWGAENGLWEQLIQATVAEAARTQSRATGFAPSTVP